MRQGSSNRRVRLVATGGARQTFHTKCTKEAQWTTEVMFGSVPFSCAAQLPNFATGFCRADHRRSGLATECLLKLRQVRQWADDTILAGGMRVRLDHQTLSLRADF